MPELPEVEVVRRGLVGAIVGQTLADVTVIGRLGERILRRSILSPQQFGQHLTGRTIVDIARRGKYLWWAFDDGSALLAHLGMSGQFRVSTSASTHVIPSSHTRVRFTFTAANVVLDYVDQRTFGSLQWVDDGARLPAPIAHIARDPLDPAFDMTHTAALLTRKNRAVKRLLLDQSVISGIGNIYADEALWHARVHYGQLASDLGSSAITAVLEAAQQVMTAALAAGGTSFDELYVDVAGNSGYFERSLNVYGRAGARCLRCQAVIVREKFAGRSCFFCPVCQPAP